MSYVKLLLFVFLLVVRLVLIQLSLISDLVVVSVIVSLGSPCVILKAVCNKIHLVTEKL